MVIGNLHEYLAPPPPLSLTLPSPSHSSSIMNTLYCQLAFAMIMMTILVFRSSVVVAENLLQAVKVDKTLTKPFPPSPPPLPPSPSPSPSPFTLLKKKKSPPPPPPPPPPPSPPPRQRRQPPPPPPPPYVPHFDYFMLALQWPVSFCLTKQCLQTPPKFIIHGLWPQNNIGAQPHDCVPSSNIGGLPDKTKLGSAWPDLTQSDKVVNNYLVFWLKQWRKHGTCSLMDSSSYFNLALDLYGKQIITNLLREGGISPGGPESIDTNKIVAAIYKNIGYTPQLQCEQGYLLEVRLCFDKASN